MMKSVTEKEWENTPGHYKNIYGDIPYMVYKDREGVTYFGPVKIKEEDA